MNPSPCTILGKGPWTHFKAVPCPQELLDINAVEKTCGGRDYWEDGGVPASERSDLLRKRRAVNAVAATNPLWM